MTKSPFTAAYYRHWYGNPKTRAFTKADKKKRAAFVLAALKQFGVPVKSVCDIGCGLGHWREALSAKSYTGVEVSSYLCEKYGWVQSSAADYAPKRQFDLVICQAVLYHLDNKDCARALKNIGTMCRGALYLEVVTKEDWTSGILDKKHTESIVYLRPAAWYRRHLAKYFVALGGGLFLAKSAGVPLLELEKAHALR
jgi:SAM-dependent methyltransferase